MKRHLYFIVCACALVMHFCPVQGQTFKLAVTPGEVGPVIQRYRSKYPDCNLLLQCKPGAWYLDSTIVITASMTNGKGYTVLEGAAGKTVISGGQKIQPNWETWKNGIFRAAVDVPYEFDQLYIDGQQQVRARYPNYDATARHYHGAAADAISKERVASWKHPEGGYIHALHRAEWGGYHYRITGVNADSTLQLEGGYQNNRQMGMHKSIRFVENIQEELDTAQEWFYDKANKYLYYKPAPGTNLKGAAVVVSRHKELIVLKGNAAHPVKNFTVKDIRFTQCAATFMDTREPLLRSDWAIYRGGVILMDGTRNCAVKNCDFNNNGGNAVFLSNYNRRDTISDNYIHDIGGNGICFVGNPDAVRSPLFEYGQRQDFSSIDTARGPKNSHYPDSCAAIDNLIHDIGQIEKQVAGVQISMSANILVRHNSIYNLPRSGINVNEGTWGGHIIEYNDVFNTVLETGDHGSFNSWGRDRWWYPDRKEMDSLAALYPWLVGQDAVSPTILRYNRFRCDHGWDIDLDDGSSNYEIYSNVCLHGGLKLREGFNRKVSNNIIINNSFHPHVWFKNSGDVFVHNIVMTGYQPIGIHYWGKEIDHNYFPDLTSLNVAQIFTDRNSSYGDPQFSNPGKGDYHVNSQAALRTGFRNFDQHQFGVTAARLKKIAQQPVFPELTIATTEQTISWDWKNGTFKNIETLGERSATGMPDNEGVLVVKAPQPAFGLKDGDVILQVGNKKITQLNELKAVVDQINSNSKLTVFRGQRAITL
ncbi:parallel beta helix pectate lyase-like protein [Chitinophaga dinghuensis]|uniref:Parallel beta helix pectate lyase-like protein n=1 Tax=Chitinophaga dinghuensis TaxID=1539050 RepID=A0A327W006_9BACT|nr:PDZ domain-containing protein [Chitinophaga dinghuensis]RAJ82082.1 parallel beta helix pectate lyase-like protein [Chitinophaga dinghuensis]